MNELFKYLQEKKFQRFGDVAWVEINDVYMEICFSHGLIIIRTEYKVNGCVCYSVYDEQVADEFALPEIKKALEVK